MKPLVVISDPHFFEAKVRVGAHQYADAFIKRGWDVIYVTADFFLPRCFMRTSLDRQIRTLWLQTRRLRTLSGVTNLIFGHFLPRSARLAFPQRIAANFYSPPPRNILRRINRDSVDLLWLHGHEDFLHFNAWPHQRSLVRLFDHYEQSSTFRRCRTKRLLASVDGVVACSQAVRSEYLSARSDIHLVPNGVDFEHFSRNRGPLPDWLTDIPNPRILYVGAIANWFDWDLLNYLSIQRPNYSFILVGPVVGGDGNTHSCARNVYVIGPKPYAELPAIMRAASCGIVPFRSSKLVAGVSPIKVYEYLAAGLPTVATYWEELQAQKLPISLATDHSAFLRQLDSAISFSTSKREELRESVRDCSWDRRLDSILRAVRLNQ